MDWTRARFELDGLGTYGGLHRGESWNGWACPVFERDEAERIAADFRAQGDTLPGDFEATYDANVDAFLFRHPDGELLAFGASPIEVDGDTLSVYYIGTSYWTWETAE